MHWIYVEHKETGGAARIPDQPGVLDWYEAHGWKVGFEPDPGPFVPPKGGAPSVEDEWVELVHLATGASHRFPNNPEALEGAYEVGWQFPKLEKPTKKTVSVKASTEPATDNKQDEGVTSSG